MMGVLNYVKVKQENQRAKTGLPKSGLPTL
jgi:hypothetical protein